MVALLLFVRNGVRNHAGAGGCEVYNRRPVLPAPLGSVRPVPPFRSTREHGFEAMPKWQNAKSKSRRKTPTARTSVPDLGLRSELAECTIRLPGLLFLWSDVMPASCSNGGDGVVTSSFALWRQNLYVRKAFEVLAVEGADPFDSIRHHGRDKL